MPGPLDYLVQEDGRAALLALVNQCKNLSSLSSTTLLIEVRLGLSATIVVIQQRITA